MNPDSRKVPVVPLQDTGSVDAALQQEDNQLRLPSLARRVSIMSAKTSDSGGSVSVKPTLRRRSSLRNAVQSVSLMLGMRRRSLFRRDSKPKPKLENTYKTKPDEGHEFRSAAVRSAVEDVLRIHLKDVTYDPKQIKTLTCQLSTMIQHKVKGLGFERHKLICNVIVGQRQDQGVNMTSRCLWDPVSDNWACAEFVNDTVFAIATVHGVYFD